MYYFITELQKRPDGIVNSTLTTRSNLANGLSYFYDRTSKAVANKDFVSVALILQSERGDVVRNEFFVMADYEE